MADSTGIGKLLRDVTQAYVDGLSTIGGAIADLSKRRIPYVAAIDQGFAIWERRIRQTIAPAQTSKAPASQIESWLQEWRDANESFIQSIRDSGLGEEALKQTRELRKAFDDGLKNLAKLWQPSTKSGRR
jgi:hypothetical protein